MTDGLSKTAKMIRKNRVIIIGGRRMKVLDPPTTEDDPQLGTLYAFRCEVLADRTVHTVRRTPNARIEVER